MKREELKFAFADICLAYLKAFCDKHEYDIEWELKHGGVWVCDEPGGVANIGDLWVNFDDIRYDVDNNIDVDMFEKWYWESLDRTELGVKYVNYKSFCSGAPDPISPDQLEKIKIAKKRLEEAQSLFDEAVKSHTYEKV